MKKVCILISLGAIISASQFASANGSLPVKCTATVQGADGGFPTAVDFEFNPDQAAAQTKTVRVTSQHILKCDYMPGSIGPKGALSDLACAFQLDSGNVVASTHRDAKDEDLTLNLTASLLDAEQPYYVGCNDSIPRPSRK